MRVLALLGGFYTFALLSRRALSNDVSRGAFLFLFGEYFSFSPTLSPSHLSILYHTGLKLG